MQEHTELTEKNAVTEKPKKIWDGALKMVRGENSAQLIENFTAEMTLVAEGLCEDQSNLRRDVERTAVEEDRRIQALQSRVDAAETSLEEERRAHDRDLTELRNRLAALEKKANAKPATDKKRKGNIIRDLTVLVAIAAAAWVIVTLVNKLL
jgi:Flp pilus assembly protein TadB